MTRAVRARILAGSIVLAVGAASLGTVVPSSAAPPEDGFGARAEVGLNEATGKVGFVGTQAGRPLDVGLGADASVAQIATTFLRDHARTLGLGSSGDGVKVTEQHATPGGGSAVRLSQSIGGVPVLGGEFMVNLDADGGVLSALGEASPVEGVSTTPRIDGAAAARRAVAVIAKQEKVDAGALRASEPGLRIYDPRLLGAPGPLQTGRLAWVMDVTRSGQATTVDEMVVVDAATGAVALTVSNIKDARDRIVCDSASTAAEYPCTPEIAEWTETSQPAGQDPDVATAFRYAGDTYDFFFNRFGRDSLDGNGLQLRSTTDFCPDVETCPYQNAFWDGQQLVYGDGFAAADDVVGHELTHGVTDFSSGLFYYQQSGAINESMSDVFGEFIDLTNTGGNDNAAVRWQLGEDIPGFGAIRNMADPTVFGDPDRMLSPFYTSDPAEGDGGGVHLNSGVNNKAAYLMTDGGSFNGQTITGLGITKAARIYYTVNTSMLVSGSDYADLANALRQACTNLAGAGTDGITTADCAQVEKVVLATEMDQNPTNSPTSQPKPCPTGGAPVDVWYDNLENPSGQLTAQTIVGPNGWYYPQNTNPFGVDLTYATSGVTNIFGDNGDVASDSALRMTNPVAVPPGAYFSFNHAFGFEDDDSRFAAYDGGVVEYSIAGASGPWQDAGPLFTGSDAGGYNGTMVGAFDNPLGGRKGFVRESNGYGGSRVDLSSLAGQRVMLRWRIGTDTVGADYGWFIDDPRIYTCDSTGPDTTITSGPKAGSFIKDRTPTFAFTASEAGSTFRCSVDGSQPVACASPYTTAKLADGRHTVAVAAVDTRGNADASPATRTFTVDKQNPKTFIARRPAPRKAKEDTAYFRIVSNEKGVRFKCKLDQGKYKSCKPRPSFTVKPGLHVLRVKAIDRAGNQDRTPAERKWRLKR